MSHPVHRKLECFGVLPEEDRTLVEKMIATEREVPSRTDLICEGDDPNVVHLITSGFACRYKRLEDGRRQIVAFLIPGDFGDPHIFLLKTMDHSISTLAPSRVARVPKTSFLEMLNRPALAKAIFMAALADSATLREWVTTIGRRSAAHRIAHLFCELHARLRAVDLIDGDAVRLPITQVELSDAVGLSAVQTNRSLQSLREQRLITFEGGKLKLLDARRLEHLCGFDPAYLHLRSDRGRHAV